MFPAPFDYQRAHSTQEAIAALGSHGADARVLAGGQSLIPAMRYRLARPPVLIDINPVTELAYFNEADGYLSIGAGTRDVVVERASFIPSRYHMIADASVLIADPVVRQMGTVVGSLCHNDPAGDWPAVALAGRASVVLRSGAGTRVVPIDEFIVDSYTTCVRDGEMAVEVRFPVPGTRTSGSYQKIERKVGDFATAAAAAHVTLGPDGKIAEAGIAIGAVGPSAMRVAEAEKLLLGNAPGKELIAQAAREAEKLADPSPDNRGSIEYKKAMAGVLVRRALTKAFERLGVGGLS